MDNRYNELRSLSKGDGGRGGLNLTIIKNINVELPTLEEQKLISTYFNSIDSKIQTVHKQIEDLKIYKTALLQQMFCY